MLNFLQYVLVCIKIDMVRLDTCLDSMGGFQDSRMYDVVTTSSLRSSMFATTFIMGVSLSNGVVSIYRIFVGNLLKCHGTSNSSTKNSMHQPHIVSSEWGQRWNFFNMCLYASKFDMVRLDTCLDGMGGFQDSRIYDHVIQKHFFKISALAHSQVTVVHHVL